MTVIDALNDSECFVITAHKTPDGDAVGASLALGMALKKAGKEVSVVLEGYNERFHIIPGRALLHAGDMDALLPNTTLVALDCGSAARMGAAEGLLAKAGRTVNIDHHLSNTHFAQINVVDVNASSTCEIVFRILDEMHLIDRDIAGALYAGIVFDTGGLRHNSTTLATIDVVARLMAYDIPFTQIYNELMHVRSLAEAKALGRAMEHIRLYENGAIACTYIDHDDLAESGATISDLGDICEYIAGIAGVQVAVFFYHRLDGKGLKISMRAKRLPVNEVCARFGGGGHKLAAGCDFNGTIEQARDAVLDLLKPMLLWTE